MDQCLLAMRGWLEGAMWRLLVPIFYSPRGHAYPEVGQGYSRRSIQLAAVAVFVENSTVRWEPCL